MQLRETRRAAILREFLAGLFGVGRFKDPNFYFIDKQLCLGFVPEITLADRRRLSDQARAGHAVRWLAPSERLGAPWQGTGRPSFRALKWNSIWI